VFERVPIVKVSALSRDGIASLVDQVDARQRIVGKGHAAIDYHPLARMRRADTLTVPDRSTMQKKGEQC
jgi:hypothetical protein